MNETSRLRTPASRVYGVFRVLLMVTILGYLGWQIYQGRPALASLRPQWEPVSLGGALLSAFIAYQCLVLGWLVLLRRSGYYRPENLGRYMRIWWVSYLYRYVPGKVLLVVERSRMGMSVGIPGAPGAALTIVEPLLAILAGSAVSLLSIAFYASGPDRRLLAGVVIVAIGVVFLFPAGFRLLVRTPFIRNRYPELQAVAFGFGDILVAVLPYLLHYLLLGLSFLLLCLNLQLFTWSALPGLCGIYALSHVVSLIAWVAPGGLGVREGALAVQLARVLPTGVGEALAIGVRVWFTLVELVSYLGVLVFCPSLPEGDAGSRPMPASKPERLR